MMRHNHKIHHIITVWYNIVKNRSDDWAVLLHSHRYNDTIIPARLLNFSDIQSKFTHQTTAKILPMLERVAYFYLVNGLVTSIIVISI